MAKYKNNSTGEPVDAVAIATGSRNFYNRVMVSGRAEEDIPTIFGNKVEKRDPSTTWLTVLRSVGNELAAPGDILVLDSHGDARAYDSGVFAGAFTAVT